MCLYSASQTRGICAALIIRELGPLAVCGGLARRLSKVQHQQRRAERGQQRDRASRRARRARLAVGRGRLGSLRLQPQPRENDNEEQAGRKTLKMGARR